MQQDVGTQVNLESEVMNELKIKIKKLEDLNYNTRFNSGKLGLLDDINEKDEFLSLRHEFKNLVHINQKLKNKMMTSSSSYNYFNDKEEKGRYVCCCIIT